MSGENKIEPKFHELAGQQTLWITDFDGIIGSDMIYSREGKEYKTINFGVRDAINLLKAYGQEIHCITSDSSNVGRLISKQLCDSYGIGWHSVKSPEEKLDKIFELCQGREFIYIGDDLFDANVARYAKLFFYPKNGPLGLVMEKMQKIYGTDGACLCVQPLKTDRYLLEAVITAINPELIIEYFNSNQYPDGRLYISFITGVDENQYNSLEDFKAAVEESCKNAPYKDRVSSVNLVDGVLTINCSGYPSIVLTKDWSYKQENPSNASYIIID